MPRGFRGADRKKYHHPTWHYINMIAYLNDKDEEAIGPINWNLESRPTQEQTENMNVIQAINFAKHRSDEWPTMKHSPTTPLTGVLAFISGYLRNGINVIDSKQTGLKRC